MSVTTLPPYLPTHPLDVETWLRKLAEGSHGYRDGEYPFLFGMATVKLAEAHAEIKRLLNQQLPSWECGCGATNGINLASCGLCLRPRSEGGWS